MYTATDTELLDWLERQNAKRSYSGRCVFRWSTTGRGWRLHETSERGAQLTVRHAIAEAMSDADDTRQSPADTMRAHLDTFRAPGTEE